MNVELQLQSSRHIYIRDFVFRALTFFKVLDESLIIHFSDTDYIKQVTDTLRRLYWKTISTAAT